MTRVLLGAAGGFLACFYVGRQEWAPVCFGRRGSQGSTGSDSFPISAVCILRPDGNSGVNGVVRFQQTDSNSPVSVHGEVSGLSPGNHGFHVHQLGDLTNGCKSAKGHYNPFGKEHGGPSDVNRHVGDLGNILANENGEAIFDMQDSLLRLSGVSSIIGRSIVCHKDEDDLGRGGFPDSKSTGHAGSRLACGIIGRAS